MSQNYDYVFNIKGQNFHLTNEEKSPSFTSFDMSTKNQNIRVVQEMGANSNYNINEENMEYNPNFIKNIKGNINFI